jgi:hypothetical protein
MIHQVKVKSEAKVAKQIQPQIKDKNYELGVMNQW